MYMTEEEVKRLKGLSKQDVEERIKKYGYNELPTAKKRSILHIIVEVVKEPMFMLLVVCGLLYLILGDLEGALMLLGFVFVMMGITIYQENKTENALDALKDLSAPRALVIRDGEQIRIPGKEVVVDDYVIVREGDRIPADCYLVWGRNLTVDESLLTGESVPVRKMASKNLENEVKKPGGDDLPFMFSGTLVVQGEGVAKITETGINTEIGKIGKALKGIEEEETTLQKETGKLVKMIFGIAVILCTVLIVIYGITKGNWLDAVLSGITLAMAMLPEEFPVVLTIFLALGAWRMSKKQVLTRRMAAVETLGAATVLCTDKTGTLTLNKMTVKKLYNNKEFYDIKENKENNFPEEFHELVEYGVLASKKDPFDPMEKALKDLGDVKLQDTEHIHEDWELHHEYPLTKELLALSHAWKSKDHIHYEIGAKGAPEAVMDLCHLPEQERKIIAGKVTEMANEGLRILGVAKSRIDTEILPEDQHELDFEFVGLIGWEDPVRDTVPVAIEECHRAGVRVVMITGDYPATAQSIAREIGLDNPEKVITGPELDKFTDKELREKINDVNVFARVVPEQKLKIVEALKANGEVVAMTGDGVNDAPALKAAHIGVAMGERGTDVAREASAIVLLKDDFTSIVSAVRLGRRIFDNLKKAMSYIISVHVPIAGIALLPVFFKWPSILFPIHVVFMELIIDPACSIVFEQEEEEEKIMERPPRKPDEPLFNSKMLVLSVVNGLIALLAVALTFSYSLSSGLPETTSRAMAFVTLIICNLGLIIANRSLNSSIAQMIKVPNKAFKWIVLVSLGFLLIAVNVPFAQGLFKFTGLSIIQWVISIGIGLAGIICCDISKLFIKIKK